MKNRKFTEKSFKYLKKVREQIICYLKEAENNSIIFPDTMDKYSIAVSGSQEDELVMLEGIYMKNNVVSVLVSDLKYDSLKYVIELDNAYNATMIYIIEAIEEYIEYKKKNNGKKKL